MATQRISKTRKKEIGVKGQKNQGRKRRHRSWADLPQEIIALITTKCGFMDQLSLHSVCKNWNSIDRVASKSQLPWLVVVKCESSKMYDPLYKKAYKSLVHLVVPHWNPPEPRFYGSKFGWLLLSSMKSAAALLYLYNPFTGDTVSLPLLGLGEMRRLFEVVAFSISSAPSSPDCTCVVFADWTHKYSFFVGTCRVGDKEWIAHEFDGYKFYPRRDVAYSNGAFYFAERSGRLATFSVAQQRWSVLIAGPEFHNVPSRPSFSTHVVESEGDVLLIRMYYGNGDQETACVWRLDLEEKGWVEVKTLGKRALFLGNGTSLAFKMTATNHQEIQDRIFTGSSEDVLKYYCLKSLGNGRCSTLYGSLANKRDAMKFWIQTHWSNC